MIIKTSEYALNVKTNLDHIYGYIRDNSELKIEKFKSFHDRGVRKIEYNIGDRVWLQELKNRLN